MPTEHLTGPQRAALDAGADDVWTLSRVCGTFKERVGWHPCQMPVQLLDRIVLACSNPEDLVLDPFSGSGTTLVSAARNGRRWVGVELSQQYAAQAAERVQVEGVAPAGASRGQRGRGRRPAPSLFESADRAGAEA